jgi:hypothetical protein
MEFHRTGHYNLMYMKTKELGWKKTHGIQNIGIEDSQGNRIVDQRQVLKIWENYVTELYDRPNRPETLQVQPEEEVDTDEKGPYTERGIRRLTPLYPTNGLSYVPGSQCKMVGGKAVQIWGSCWPLNRSPSPYPTSRKLCIQPLACT